MRLQRSNAAFTIIELLAVIGIMAMIAALAAPTLRNFRKGDSIASATRQMLDAVGRARQLAIGQHTTVYMVFVPTNFWELDPSYPNDVAGFLGHVQGALQAKGLIAVTNVIDKQLTGYTFVSLRSIGDQPGQSTPRYLDGWQTLPEGTFIPPWKFSTDVNYTNHVLNPINNHVYDVGVFQRGVDFPFPSENAYYYTPPCTLQLPYIAFDYTGRLISEVDNNGNYHDAFIPLAQGSVAFTLDLSSGGKTFAMNQSPPQVIESPVGNSTNSFNLIHIDWLTGRARLEHQEVQ